MRHTQTHYSLEDLRARGVDVDDAAVERVLARFGGRLPRIAGGDPTLYPDAIGLPLPGPTISGTTFTADFLLQDVRRVTRVIADLTLERFYVDQVFAPAGDITGGAVIYEQAERNEIYATRDVQHVQPGKEFPIVTFDRTGPKTAQVEKFGGKFPVTDEARRRNAIGRVNQAMQRLANTIVRKTQQRAIAELEAAITAFEREEAGTSWADASELTETTRSGANSPVADLALVEELNEDLELGYSYDMAIMNPAEWANLRKSVAGGTSASARALLADSGIDTVWVTKRKAAGSVYWLAKGQVGEIGYEEPLSTETWRDPEGRQQNWYQSSILPIMYVTDPYAILETTGHASLSEAPMSVEDEDAQELGKLNRDELEQVAAERGVEDPKGFKTKADLVDAIQSV